MANEIKIAAEPREEFGKGASRRIRAEHKVPVVVYGHGTEPVHLIVPGHETMLALRAGNALLSLQVEGREPILAIAKDVQRDPITGELVHVDFLIVRRGEKVTVEIPVVLVGEIKEAGAQVNQDQMTLALDVDATNIPSAIEIEVTNLTVGDKITVADITLPEGASYEGSESAEENILVSVTMAKEETEEETSEAADEDAE